MPVQTEEIPSTIERSPKKVRETYAKALDNAHAEYRGDEERAHRTAFAAVKHIAEKKGDHWELKDHKGPSDAQAAQGGKAARDRPKKTHGGVDAAGNSKQELYERAKKLDVEGRSNMNKEELADAIARKQD